MGIEVQRSIRLSWSSGVKIKSISRDEAYLFIIAAAYTDSKCASCTLEASDPLYFDRRERADAYMQSCNKPAHNCDRLVARRIHVIGDQETFHEECHAEMLWSYTRQLSCITLTVNV